MLKKAICLLVAMAGMAMAAPSTASAQGWLSNPTRAEGPGIKVGDFELHPGLGVQAGYDSNIYLRDDEGTLEPAGDALLRVAGHLFLSTRGTQRLSQGEEGLWSGKQSRTLTLRGGLSGTFYHFFENTERDNVAGQLDLVANIAPSDNFSLTLSEQFQRTIRPFVDVGTGALDGTDPDGGNINPDDISYGRNRNEAGIALGFSSDGDLLRASLGYRFAYTFYDDQVFDYVENFEHIATLRASWQFLPHTAVIHRTEVSFQDYVADVPGGDAERAPTLINDNIRLRSWVGVNGALTNDFSFLAMIGYGAGFYEIGDDFDSLLARAEVRWHPGNNLFTLGYERNFYPSYVGNFIRADRIYLDIEGVFSSFVVGVQGGVTFDTTGRALAVTPGDVTNVTNLLGNSATRDRIKLQARLFLEYRLTDYFGMNAGVGWMADLTDYQVTAPRTIGIVAEPAAFNRFEAWIGGRVMY